MDSVRIRELAAKAAGETDPGVLKNIVAKMMVILRAEQSDLRQAIVERVATYHIPPQQPY